MDTIEATNFTNAKNFFLLGLDEMRKCDYGAAKRAFLNSLELMPDRASTLSNLSAVLAELGEYTESLNTAEKAIALDPESPEPYVTIGTIKKKQRDPESALFYFNKALSLNSEYHVAHSNKGAILADLGRNNEALASYRESIRINPSYAEAYYNLGVLQAQIKNHKEAISAYNKAIELNPLYSDAYYNLAALFGETKQFSHAIESFKKLIELKPDQDWAIGSLFHAQMKICDWSFYQQSLPELRNSISNKKRTILPFSLLGLPSSLAEQKLCAEIYTQSEIPSSPRIACKPLVDWNHSKIKIAYLSADYHDHATTHLMAELFELHDRARFEVIGICYGRSPDDAMRKRIAKSFDIFLELGEKTDLEVSQTIHDLEIDIAVDLKGHTHDSRLGVLANRPAPIQVHYLGYPGTIGADFVDYLVVDPVLVKPEDHPFYTEKIVCLPDTYQVNDRSRKIAGTNDTRLDHGLPKEGFVFCCFNNNWKITPDIYDTWLEILRGVEGSVLWLFRDNELAASNLIKEAEARGVNPARLVFADKLPLDEHLARHKHADLFLDTLYYNAHTTASDALWAGLPVITAYGETYASRVAASLLRAINLSELITYSVDEYKSLAIKLATHPVQLAALKQKLKAHRLTTPLFDTPRFTKNLENAYEQMVKRHQQGLPPDHIYVPDA